MTRIIALRLAIGIVLPAAVFALFAVVLQDAAEIQLYNSIRLSLSTGVLVAYVPPVARIVFDPRPLHRGDYLSFGIVYSWLGACGSGVWWVVYQLLGRPPSMVNTDSVAATIFLGCLGALFHLAAPGALERRIPPVKWAIIGSLVAVGMLGALLIFDAETVSMRLRGVLGVHELPRPPKAGG